VTAANVRLQATRETCKAKHKYIATKWPQQSPCQRSEHHKPSKRVHGTEPSIHVSVEDAAIGRLATLGNRVSSTVVKPNRVPRIVIISQPHRWTRWYICAQTASHTHIPHDVARSRRAQGHVLRPPVAHAHALFAVPYPLPPTNSTFSSPRGMSCGARSPNANPAPGE
jgi:hypothetical protein